MEYTFGSSYSRRLLLDLDEERDLSFLGVFFFGVVDPDLDRRDLVDLDLDLDFS